MSYSVEYKKKATVGILCGFLLDNNVPFLVTVVSDGWWRVTVPDDPRSREQLNTMEQVLAPEMCRPESNKWLSWDSWGWLTIPPKAKPAIEEPEETDEDLENGFEEWWEKHGCLIRSGGGQYECTFARHAWREVMKKLLASAEKAQRQE